MPESKMPESKQSQTERPPRRSYRMELERGQGGSEIVRARSLAAVIRRARKWCDEDWSTVEEEDVIYAHIDIYRLDHPSDPDAWAVHSEHRQVGMTAPDCIGDEEHDWQAPYEIVGGITENPGCWGDGGGVRCRAVCALCGAYRQSGNWGQCMEDGVQGLDWESYEDADEVSEEWALAQRTDAMLDAVREAVAYSIDDDDLQKMIRRAMVYGGIGITVADVAKEVTRDWEDTLQTMGIEIEDEE